MRVMALIVLMVVAVAGQAHAELVTREVKYRHGEVELIGFMAYDTDAAARSDGKLPGVLIVQEGWGLNDYARSRAKQLAELGYVAFCVDTYANGKVTKDPKQASAWATKLYGNTALWRARVRAGLDTFAKLDAVDADRIGAMGYCFGGATSLQLALSGAPIKAAVSFHGSLPAPGENDTTKASILVCHGAADTFVKPEEIAAFTNGMDRMKADWAMVSYGHAVHSFTNPGADAYGIDGVAYDRKADQRSWMHMRAFFKEHLWGSQEAAAMVVHVDAEGDVMIDGKVVGDDVLVDRLKHAAQKRMSLKIVADPRAKAKAVVKVMDEAENAGVKSVSIATRR